MMNYDIHIENLGAIEKADITITPLTILAGENGTGKSFVTKFLYSILNVTILDVFSNELNILLLDIQNNIPTIISSFGAAFPNSNSLEVLINLKKELDSFFSEIKDDLQQSIFFLDSDKLKRLKSSIEAYNEIILPIFNDEKENKQETIKTKVSDHGFNNLILKYTIILLSKDLEMLSIVINSPRDFFVDALENNINNELKNNFQVSQISYLIQQGKDKAIFDIKDTIKVEILEDSSLEVFFDEEKLFNYGAINRILFFESPVYWKMLSMIDNKKENTQKYLSTSIKDERLTGVPKHFIDLKELLFANFKDGERPDFIIKCADELESKLQGKFKAANSDLTFENSKGQSISKSLVSFGMTNLGIFQAVLSKNIINKGSFVFIDEPESNLHPEWQAILANVLVELAKNGVYVIVTTHSSDMLKAFEISTQEQKVSDELSTYYFQTDGTLLAMDDEDLSPIEQARKKLLETYENLMIRGYLL